MTVQTATAGWARRWWQAQAITRVGVAIVVGLLMLTVACGGGDEAPTLNQPNATGAELANQFLTLLQKEDVSGLQGFLSDAFILQRADGSTATKVDYLPNLPRIGQFQVGDVKALQDANTLVVHWTLTVQETINGQVYSGSPAPRLSTFAWSNDAWRMISHANFNAPQ